MADHARRSAPMGPWSRWLLLGAWLLSACSPAPKGTTAEPPPVATGPMGAPSPSAQIPTPLPTTPPPAQGWTRYLGVNEVHGVAFAPGGVLWAATTGGVARWDLAASTYTQYTTADGLPSDYANDVAVAPDGSVWAALLGGVSHLDGRVVTSYTAADGLANEAAQSIAVTADGQVWLGTVSGVSRFDGRSWTSFLPGVRAWKVAVAPDGSVWAANDGAGVSRYSPADDAWTTYGTEQGLPNVGVKTVAVAPDGGVWIYVGYDQVYRNDGARWREVVGISVPWVLDIAFDTNSAAWIATGAGLHGGGYGLLAPRGDAWDRLTSEQGLGSNVVFTVEVAPGGLVAAGTMEGLSILQEGHWRTLRGGPARNQVTSVAVTPDGAAWFGFGDSSSSRGGSGVSRFDGHTWQFYLDGLSVTALAVDPQGRLWAGAGCTLRRWDGRTWADIGGGCDALQGGVVDLAFTPSGEVWVASGMKLGRYAGQAWTFYDRSVGSVAAAPDGVLWISGWKGTQGSEYTARFNGSAWTEYPGGKASLTVTPDGQVWGIDAFQGLMRFDGQAWSAFATAASTGLASIDWLAVAPDGSLWMNGNGDLAHLHGDAWRVYPGAGAAAVAFADDGSLWLGTNNGAVHFNPDTTGE